MECKMKHRITMAISVAAFILSCIAVYISVSTYLAIWGGI